jgi:phosphoglycerate dehydrogenase-like enzyme
MPEISRIGILDDYQGVALALGPWHRVMPHAAIEVFRDTLKDPDALAARLAAFDALVIMRERTPFPRALIERLPHLRLLVTTGARNRSIDVAACAERGITVCGTGSFAHPTVDLTWALILALVRGIPAQERALREGRWQGLPLGMALEGRTLGVIGLGTLGSRVARVGAAFGMRLIAWSQNLTAERATAAGAALVDKPTLLREADIVTLHLVLSDRSRGTIGAAEFALMQRGAFIVNTSRGPLIDQAALIAALHDRRIAGAGLDVFDEEPLPAGHPLLAAPNTVLTPHLGYVAEENYRVFFTDAVEAVLGYREGRPVREVRAG